MGRPNVNINVYGNKSGMTKTYSTVVLRQTKTVAEQLIDPNTIYEIRYDFDLNGETITVPEDCVLEFKGGSFSNGKLSFEGNIPVINIAETQEVTPNDVFYTEHIINNPILNDVSIIGLRTTIRIKGGKFSFNDQNSDVIAATCCNLYIDGISMIGTARYFINSTNRIVSSGVDTIVAAIDTNINISDSRIVGKMPITPYTAVSLFAAFHKGNTREIERPTKCSAIVSNCYINTEGRPLSIRGLDNIEITGGDFSGGEGILVYSCLSSVVSGGYYHGSTNGPIVGGTEGEYAVISNNIVKDITGHGTGIDWAQNSEAPFTYSRGYGIISGNVIDDCNFPIYCQGKNLNIANNVINANSICAESANHTAIRINSRDTESDDAISVVNNIVNCNNKLIIPVMLGSDTYCYTNNNYVLNNTNTIDFQASTGGGFVNPTVRILRDIVNRQVIYIANTVDLVLIESATAAFTLRFGYPKMVVPTKQITVVNKSDYTGYIVGSDSDIIVKGNTAIPAGHTAIVTVVDNNTLFVNSVSMSAKGKTDGRPTLTDEEIGYEYYDTTLKQPIYWNGNDWTNANGETI